MPHHRFMQRSQNCAAKLFGSHIMSGTSSSPITAEQ
jgi:hypothetical protein